VVERERENKDFPAQPTTAWSSPFESVDNITDGWKSAWQVKPWLEEGQEYLLDKALAEKVSGTRSLDVIDCQESESHAALRLPSPRPACNRPLPTL
jgi:DNA topoisomerase-1